MEENEVIAKINPFSQFLIQYEVILLKIGFLWLMGVGGVVKEVQVRRRGGGKPYQLRAQELLRRL